MPTISVIVPVYKVEKFLHRCVDSILGQSFSDFELILVDDGSPDQCGSICEEYALRDSRVHVIHQENGGLSAARNTGIEWAFANSDSQWLTFIDSDDWVHKDYLEVLFSSAQDKNASISICEFKCTDTIKPDAQITNKKCMLQPSEDAYTNHYSICMTACCKLYKKILFSQLRFPVGKLHEDAYITHFLLFAAKKVAVCDAELYYYYSNQNSITRVKWSEKRLDQIDAHEHRLAFLEENGYSKAYKRELEAYVLAVSAQIQDLTQLSNKDSFYRKYLKQLRPKLRFALRLARKQGMAPFGKENLWIYESAYPIKPIWYAGYLAEKILSK